jgi:MFS transporter, DHA1 family, inner membrane transport protein
MAYLRNRAVNWLTLHSGIRALAQGMGGVFTLVFLLRSGVSVPMALCAMALVVAGRFSVRPAILPAATRSGLKPLAIAGTLASALQYPLLARVEGVDGTLLLYCAVSALGEAVYWTCHHAYIAMLGDTEERGQQISAIMGLATLASVIAPLAGAWMLLEAGPALTFGAVGVIHALGAAPLLALPNVRVPRAAAGALRASLPGVGLFLSDGWLEVSYALVWQIALYLSLGSSLVAYGGAMALAALVGVVSGLVLGRHIDAGHGRRAVVLAFSLVAATFVLRALSLETPWLAVAGNALGAFAVCLLGPAQMTPVYNLAKASPCALRFHIAAEGAWDVGCCAACLLSALLIARGAPLSAVMLLGFAGVAGQVFLLRRSYLRLGAWGADRPLFPSPWRRDAAPAPAPDAH